VMYLDLYFSGLEETNKRSISMIKQSIFTIN
jgi:hypothetical protein